MTRRKTSKKSGGKRVKLSPEKQLFIVIALILLVFIIFLSTRVISDPVETVYVSSENLEIPLVEQREFIIENLEGRYTILYDTAYRQAAWVAYVLTRYDVQTKGTERSSGFIVDSTVKARGWSYSTNSDYYNSGYDKGHLLPSADRNNDKQENKATFLLSNISPQRPKLNRVLWNSLESEVRKVAQKYDTLYIVTGVLKGDSPQRIGINGVCVPQAYFKTILTKVGNSYKSIAFVVPNIDDLSPSYNDYAVTVDSLEKLSGYDFFYNLPDNLENAAESSCDVELW